MESLTCQEYLRLHRMLLWSPIHKTKQRTCIVLDSYELPVRRGRLWESVRI
jgi:hypothetical protein